MPRADSQRRVVRFGETITLGAFIMVADVRLQADATRSPVASGFSRTTSAAAQTSPDAAIADLKSPDRDRRLRAVRVLKDAAPLEAALPLVPLVGDPDDEIQYEAIGAELNIFLAEKVVSKRRVGGVFEVRNRVVAEAAFSAGPLALGFHPVPRELLTALLAAVPDDNAYIGMEALYAFGTLAVDAAGSARRELLRTAAPEFAAFVGASDAGQRVAALRVTGRVFARHTDDPPGNETVGDAVVLALNDPDRLVREAARAALGAMRYERAVQALTDLLLHHRRGVVADELLDALARIGHGASKHLMTTALDTGSTAMKRSAIEGLARMDDGTALTAIDQAVGRDRDESLMLARAFASVRLGKGTLEEIVNALTRGRLRDQAIGYVIELAPGRAAMLARFAQDPDPAIRVVIADALGLSGDPAALRIVEPMTRDTDPRTSRAATRAVARLNAARRPS
jgi:HEAT repeat protein